MSAEEVMDDESPAAAEDGPSEAQPAEPPAEEPATGGSQESSPLPAPEAQPVTSNAVEPTDNTVDVIGQRSEPAPMPSVAQDLDQKALAWNEDLKNQHITPKTYADLFANKSTTGKIGTLFGLLISGAGSGLAHQQNAVLGMMQKELENDFEAQKLSKSNAQNFLRLAQQHELNDAQIERLKHENNLTDAQVDNIKQDRDLKATAAAKNYAVLAGMDIPRRIYDRLPDGPTKTALGAVIPNVEQEVFKGIGARNATTQAHLDARQKLRATPEETVNTSAIDDKKLLDMKQKGAIGAQNGYTPKGGILPSDVGEVTKEANATKLNRATYAAAVDSFKKLDQAFLTGKLNPEFRNAVINNFEVALARQVGTEEAHKAIAGMFPDVKDWGTSRAEKFDKMTEHFKVNEANTDTLDTYGLKKPFPEVPNPANVKDAKASGRNSSQEGQTGKDKNGHPWVVRNGKKVYK